MSKLKNPRHEAFAQQYALTHNASEAYRQAFKAAGRMKPADIASSASRLLKNVNVASRVSELQEVVAKKAEEEFSVDATYVLKRLVEIDQMDVADILADDGSILPVKQWPKAWRRTLSAMDVAELWEGYGEEREQTGLLKKIKWPDKVKNLELLGKHVDVQAFKERTELSGGLSMTHEEALDELA
ncbi:terminase small subunit [Halomonas koreensis]|uniref:Terminase small subunit n=1 Tax=Halomonas koreensis TaxID=245385 RepID=A0ABU1G683_9GAMM|nr:terminase small subunit [Halomonas koreensis]MDR5867934.1 terminase small subunit [Halomonas koreensis]